MKIYFHSDLDGRAAGAIAWRDSATDQEHCELIEIGYKDPIDTTKIKPFEKIMILDFSFKPEVMEKVLEKTTHIIWIDHHKTAFEYKYSRELEGLRDSKFSGCELTWMYFHPNTNLPEAVELIGDKDKWAWKFGKRTASFNLGLLLYDHQPRNKIWDCIIFSETNIVVPYLETIEKEGNTCIKFRNQICNNYANSFGFETKFEGYKCFALGFYLFASEAFGDRINKYDICLAFEYSGTKWTIGLYSKTVDVSKIAKKYGGGGHKFAAGFVSKELPFKKERD